MISRRRVWALIRKDWLEVARNKEVLSSLIIVPLIFAMVLPTMVILLGGNSILTATVNGLQGFLDNLPVGIVPSGFTTSQAIIYAVLVYFMAPFFLVIPVMVAALTASSSFVGEKERGTIEGLLYTPLTNRELVLAKVLGSLIPSIVLTWAAFIVYTIIAGTLGARIIGSIFFPTWTWIVMILAIVPLVGFLATSLIVAVSGRSTTMQGAQSTAMFVVLPILALIISQATGFLLFDIAVVLIALPVLLVIDLLAFLLIVSRFDRERILTRL